ncbi:cell wall metabolism sensor histidine kinase WalK [Cyanobium sp. WAJ14-Wanaka]|uniref:sensor histidine kinase n=1 Tax=Cyanobium sp. WAJ14-Wanaka TaxID=2823725 RepID=UPI0020CCF747|nr:HAMP domain-containing sensor histidine kinase [Cyanobium sp. WAJ14-Wanaka]
MASAWLALGLLIGLCTGLGISWLGQRRLARPQGSSRLLPSVRQLLQWINASPSGWILLDRGGLIRHISPRAERLLQVNAGRSLNGRSFREVYVDQALNSAIAVASCQDRTQRLDLRLGEEEVEVLVVPGSKGWLGVQLQTRRSLEAQLEQQERWVSDVAHELKTPLTALLLVGDSLAGQVNSQNARMVERLQRELLRLQELVGDLLELSRLENITPGATARSGEVVLPELVEQVWQGLRPLADQRGVALELEPAPSLALQADRSRLHRAVLNLLDNALRYSPDGGAITVAIEERSGWLQLRVSDQGPGLSEEDLDHMFERFYRGDPSRVRSPRTGSGLGLPIVQQIAATHGGRIQAFNHPKGGAVLELTLPLGQT